MVECSRLPEREQANAGNQSNFRAWEWTRIVRVEDQEESSMSRAQ